MKFWKESHFDGNGEELSEFIFSDLELGIIQNEVVNEQNEKLDLIVFNRLEMILEINDFLNLN